MIPVHKCEKCLSFMKVIKIKDKYYLICEECKKEEKTW